MAQQQIQNALDRLDTLFTVATLTAESDQHEPGRKELKFFVDSGVQILDEIIRVVGRDKMVDEVTDDNDA